MDTRILTGQVTRALALAHAALDAESSPPVIEARQLAVEVLLLAKRAQPDLLPHLAQLGALVGLLERKLLAA